MSDAATLLPRAEVVHQLPGRLRLRIAARRGDGPFFAAMVQRVRGLAAVRSVAANPRTGSLLIEHEGAAEALTQAAADQGIFQVASPAAEAVPAARLPRPVAVAPLSATAAGLAGLGLVQVARGRALGSATENFWNGLRAFALMGRPRIAVLLAAFGLYRLVRGPALGSGVSLLYYALTVGELARWRGRRS